MSNNPKTYVIDDVLKGYTSYDKLNDIYRDLKKSVLRGKPIQSSNKPFINLQFSNPKSSNLNSGNYSWEIYSLAQSSLLMLEYFGDWEERPYESIEDFDPQDAILEQIRLTIHNPTPELEKKIESVISKYPRDSPKNKAF